MAAGLFDAPELLRDALRLREDLLLFLSSFLLFFFFFFFLDEESESSLAFFFFFEDFFFEELVEVCSVFALVFDFLRASILPGRAKKNKRRAESMRIVYFRFITYLFIHPACEV